MVSHRYALPKFLAYLLIRSIAGENQSPPPGWRLANFACIHINAQPTCSKYTVFISTLNKPVHSSFLVKYGPSNRM